MSSQWSSTDPTRRRVFLAGMAAILAILVWVGFSYVTADPPKRSTSTRPANSVPVLTPPPRAPMLAPSRYAQLPAAPVAAGELQAASDRAMAFLDAFANSRWDDRPEDKVRAIGAFVPKAALDLVLMQYEQTKAIPAAHELVTYQVTAASWRSLSERQATILVSGSRRVVGDAGDHTGSRSFVLTLVRNSSAWNVTSVRGPDDGDVGMGTA